MAARRAASQMHQQAEILREKMKKLKSQTEELLSGSQAWQGIGASMFSLQRDEIAHRLDKAATACHQYGSELSQIADRLYALQEMRKRLKQLEHELLMLPQSNLYSMGNNSGSQSYHPAQDTADQQRRARLSHDISYLRQQVRTYEAQYDTQAAQGLTNVMKIIPTVGELTGTIREWGSYLFDAGHKPVLVRTTLAQGRQGRDRVVYLNETIRMNQTVYDYYKNHPGETGPSGESADEMMKKARALMEEGRKQGGTYGVPIVFMHGLFGGSSTFDTMVGHFGGRSGVYTVEDGDVRIELGENTTGDNPCIQFVFGDGSMSFDDQTVEFTQMMQKVKAEYETDSVMVVSHSMGGIVTTQYIEETGGEDITRFVTLGSPIKGSDDNNDAHTALYHTGGGVSVVVGIFDLFNPAVLDLRTDSDAIKEMYGKRGQFNQATEVFSAIGMAGGEIHGDTIVTPKSARGLEDYANPSRFTSKVYLDSTHSGLHENEQETVDTINFILYGEKPKGYE